MRLPDDLYARSKARCLDQKIFIGEAWSNMPSAKMSRVVVETDGLELSASYWASPRGVLQPVNGRAMAVHLARRREGKPARRLPG
jgi:hypothetical protein